MARVCEFTGIRPQTGNQVSNSNRKVKTRFLPNLHRKKIHIEALDRTFTLTLSTRAIRTIDLHGGIDRALMKADERKLSQRLRQVRHQLLKPKHKAKKKETPVEATA